MIQRCRNPKSPAYRYYGARGIDVCKRWRDSFVAFLSDMGPRPSRASIERRDNDGDYEPGNCYWATRKQQMRNTRATLFVTLGGRRMCVTEAAEVLGIRPGRIFNWKSDHGCTAQEAVDHYASLEPGSALAALVQPPGQ